MAYVPPTLRKVGNVETAKLAPQLSSLGDFPSLASIGVPSTLSRSRTWATSFAEKVKSFGPEDDVVNGETQQDWKGGETKKAEEMRAHTDTDLLLARATEKLQIAIHAHEVEQVSSVISGTSAAVAPTLPLCLAYRAQRYLSPDQNYTSSLSLELPPEFADIEEGEDAYDMSYSDDDCAKTVIAIPETTPVHFATQSPPPLQIVSENASEGWIGDCVATWPIRAIVPHQSNAYWELYTEHNPSSASALATASATTTATASRTPYYGNVDSEDAKFYHDRP